LTIVAILASRTNHKASQSNVYRTSTCSLLLYVLRAHNSKRCTTLKHLHGYASNKLKTFH